MQDGPKKWGHLLMTIVMSYLNRFKKKLVGKFLGKSAAKWILKLPPQFAYVATLHCLTLMSAKQAVNDRISRYCSYILRCAGIVNDQIKKGLLLSLRVKISC